MDACVVNCKEPARVSALKRYGILDTPREKDFDDLCRLAARLCGTPVAALNFVDDEREWFKAEIGLDVRELPLGNSPCMHALLEGDTLVVPDTLEDPRFCNHPAYVSGPKLRFYAGAVIRSPDGFALGTVCVLDKRPRELDAEQLADLRTIANQVVTMLELRRQTAEAQQLATMRGQVSVLLASAEPLSAILTRCVQLLVDQLDGAFARIWTLDEAAQVLVLQASAGMYTHLDGPHGRVPVGAFKIGRIARDRRALLTNDVPNDPNIGDPEWARREGMVAFAGYPLLVEGRVVGVIAIFWRQKVSEAILDDLAPIADNVAQCVERKGAEEALTQRSEQRRLALDSAQMGSWHLDLVSGHVHWDERFKAIFGVADEELSYERVVGLLHPDDRENVRAAIAAASRPVDPVPYSVKYRVIHPDGSERWVEAHGRTHFESASENRRALFVVGTVRDITAQRVGEETLRTERELLRTVFDQAPDDAIIIMDAERTLTAWNPAAERITGWTAAEAIGQTADIIFTPGDRAAGGAKQETDTAARDGKASDERWHLRRDGSQFWGSGTMNALHHPEGGVRGYLKVFRDATARHEETETLAFFQLLTDDLLNHPSSEQIIEIVERRLGEHLRASRVLVTEASEDGQAVRVQQVWTLPGLKDLTGTHRLADFGSRIAADYAAGRAHIRRNAEQEYPPGPELDNLRAVQAIAAIDVPVRIDGRLRFVMIVHQTTPRDWTEREVALVQQVADRMAAEVQRARAERALAFERHQLELIFRESPAEMATWRGEELVFTRANPRYQDLFSARQLVGLPILEACPELAGQGFDDLLRRVLHTGEPFTGREVLARIQRDEDGPVEDRYFDFSYLQIRDPDGQPWGVYDHSVDVTDRVLNRLALEQSRDDVRNALAGREQLLAAEQTARSEAERTSQMKDEFLATLSHELRTPLNAILGWTQVLRGDPANTADMEAGLATIERNSRAQTQIIEDLLDMSKIISGKVRLDVQPLHLDQIIAASVETMRPAATAKDIRLQALIDPEARMVSGDPNRLQQVFWNLLSNAIKFTPKGGKVQVVLERVNSHLEISVADTGEGIAAEFLPYVFDRFRQQDASTTRRHGGLGLGLAIVKQLVELHGGSVRAESAGPGQGTTFKVLLPLSVVQPTPDPADPDRRHPQSGSASLPIPADRLNLAGIKVLVVDDEADARALVQRLLEDRGAAVQTAGSATEAIGLLGSQRPDVLISDIGMPGEDGYALIAQVRALPPGHGGNTPAVALTAYARSDDRLKVILAGFQMHMAKPVEAAELLALVASLAGRVAGREK